MRSRAHRGRRVAAALAWAALAAATLELAAPAHAAPVPAAAPAGGGPAQGFRPAAPGYAWSFPRDHFTHPGYRTEWWYFTGQLASVDPPGHSFGYQLTFFRVGVLPEKPPFDSPWATANLAMVHAAVSDLGAGAHLFSEVLWREMPYLAAFAPFPQHPIAWAEAPPGTGGRWTLDHDPSGGAGGVFTLAVEDRGRGLAYHLTARPEKPIAFQGPGGFSRKSSAEGYASLYYSYTRLATEGTLTTGGRTFRVRGRSWMDRELGSSQLAPTQSGWDWFALQLADGRDLMLYLLRRPDGSLDFARGTVIAADGSVRWLSAGDFTVRSTATWKSPRSGATYPARWRVEVPSAAIAVEVVPLLADQEDRGALAGGVTYWEGAVGVRDAAGTAAGEGYVELTGYGAKARPPI